MTGLPTLTVELEDAAGDFTHNISGYVRLPRGWSLSRGWSDENDEDNIQPAVLQIPLDNNDGSFTLGSPAFDGITKDKRVRLSETVGGTTYRRCVGYVVDWPTKWESALANVSFTDITAVDRMARLNRRKLRSTVDQEILLDSPVVYYQLAEPVGATTASDTSGNHWPALALGGAGTAPVFGADGADSVQTACTFAAGEYLQGVLSGTTTLPWTVEAWFNVAAPPAVDETFLWVDNAINTRVNLGVLTTGALSLFGASVSGTAGVCNGAWHHVAIVGGGLTNTLFYLDGALVATLGVDGDFALVNLFLGAAAPVLNGVALAASTFHGSLERVALWDSRLSATRVAAHAHAVSTGFSDETADDRIARLAAYANIPTGEQNLEAGLQPSIAAQDTTGMSVLDAMRAVAQAEGGALFIGGDGDLALHNKDHRVIAATGTPAAEFTVDEIDPDSIEFASLNYLFNTASGARAGGAQQVSVNSESVAKYEEWPDDRSNALLPTDELMLNQLTWITTMYAEPLSRLSTVTLDLLTLPEATVKAALALELGDYFTISGWPPHAPLAGLDLIVEGLKEAQTERKWTLTFNTAPALLFRAWVLDDATYGVLDDTTRLYF